MSNEARVQISLYITKGNLRYQSQPTSYAANVSTAKGPTPGVLAVPTSGVDVSFAQLNYPGLCWIQNLDNTNYVEWGVHDGTLFHPVGRLLPGELTCFRLSANLGEEESATGTGTTGPVNTFFLKANLATCEVRVDAFET